MNTARKRRSSGQLSLLMMLNVVPVITLFAFAVNIGMLVHAKINLQNAADTAAFAGAAHQGRMLNRISHLNYLMRMNYKKFLFRYYVAGNQALRCFPGSPENRPACYQAPNQDFLFQNRDGNGDRAFEFPTVPSVCIPPPDGTNICKLKSDTVGAIPDLIRNLPTIPGDPVADSMRPMLARIANVAVWDCNAKGAVNQQAALAWLYSTNPSDLAFESTVFIRPLLQDVGLIPANLLLMRRIEVLKDYINAQAQMNVSAQTVQRLESSPDLTAVERTVLAYKSAAGTLSAGTDGETLWGTFEKDSLLMNEMLPGVVLDLGKIFMPEFNVFYTFFGGDALATGAGNTAASCAAKVTYLKVPGGMLPLGVYKSVDGGIAKRVYYMIKLKAKARLLFNPFDELILTAYSAAAPFGSRVGPYLDPASTDADSPESLVKNYTPPREYIVDPPGATPPPDGAYPVPTISMGNGLTMSTTGVLRSYGAVLNPTPGSWTNYQGLGTKMHNGEALAMAPDPWEVGRYNIPVEFTEGGGSGGPGSTSGNNGFTQYFNGSGHYLMWAPLEPMAGSGGGRRRSVAEEIVENLAQALTGEQSTTVDDDIRVRMRNSLQEKLSRYLEGLNSAPAPDGTSATLQAMANPLTSSEQRSNISRIGIPGTATKISNPRLLATSWVGTSPAEAITHREGYSVKIVPISSVAHGGGSMRLGNTLAPGISDAWQGVRVDEQESADGVNLRSGHIFY